MNTVDDNTEPELETRPKWEYLIFEPRFDQPWKNIERQLNELGQDRWELVATSVLGCRAFVLKRPIKYSYSTSAVTPELIAMNEKAQAMMANAKETNKFSATKGKFMAALLCLITMVLLMWMSSASAARSAERCPLDLKLRLLEGMTITVARARCEQRPMSKPELDRLSKKLYGDGKELEQEGCSIASIDAIQEAINEYHADKESFCERARHLIRQHKL